MPRTGQAAGSIRPAILLDRPAPTRVRASTQRFTDTGEAYTFYIRRGVAELVRHAAEDPDMTISVSEVVWKDVIFQRRSPALAFASGDIEVDGGIIRVVRFLGLFET